MTLTKIAVQYPASTSLPSLFTVKPQARKQMRDFFSSHIRNVNAPARTPKRSGNSPRSARSMTSWISPRSRSIPRPIAHAALEE
jgi:hypothetical protein